LESGKDFACRLPQRTEGEETGPPGKFAFLRNAQKIIEIAPPSIVMLKQGVPKQTQTD